MPTIPDWARAHGPPAIQGRIRQSAEDFEVTENLGFPLSGDGEHDYLWLEKRDANSNWVAGRLARHAGIPGRDVGFAGMKDRNALTRQWFSVRRPSSAGTDWSAFDLPGVQILEATRHDRKLKRGALESNRFRIAVRDVDASQATIDEKLAVLKRAGVPNYFGDQRFGRDGDNIRLAKALFAGERLPRHKRSIALSAARAFLFNHILDRRVRDGSWNRLLAGECACLDGSNSFFVVEQPDEELKSRCERLDIHPGGALWGKGDSPCRGEVRELEQAVVQPFGELREGLEARTELSRRALRLKLHELEWERDGTCLRLAFHLRRGGYATAFLRELAITGI
ncbi:MAG: tRNA pseudouridine(13) synthase TruD [Woeseiaceae bacterium]|nr:tRNA pseudouridine(13) synthase TruD [Woeseiaceae bacterium]